jgi:hypothetical protein
MIIISYDIASKSLAASIMKFNHNYKLNLQQIIKEFHESIKTCISPVEICVCAKNTVDKIEQLMYDLIQPVYFSVVDLIPGKKMKETTVIQRTSRLKAYLNSIDVKFNQIAEKNSKELISEENMPVKVLLEYQMGPNDKSRNVCSQILYHYSTMDNEYKNSDNFNDSFDHNIDNTNDGTNKILYDIEIVGPSLKNKINMDPDKPYEFFAKKYVKTYDANKAHSKNNFLYWVKKINIPHMTKGIKKKNLDDIADSTNMTLAWLYFKSKLL